jgi:hypothetical protein
MIVWTNLDSALFCVAMGMIGYSQANSQLEGGVRIFFQEEKNKVDYEQFCYCIARER